MATTQENVSEEIPQQEVAQPETDEQVTQPDTASGQDAQTQENTQSEQESDKDHNFRAMRETLAQREEELRILRNSQESPKEEELGNEDLVEGKHLKKGLSEIKDIIRQKELEKIPDKLKAKFADFDAVVTKKTLEKLKKTEPELYALLQVEAGKKLSAEDLFVKGVAAYKSIKSLEIVKEKNEFSDKKDRIQSNHNKPMSAQAVNGSGAIHEANSFANGLTPELRKSLYKEMTEAAKAL